MNKMEVPADIPIIETSPAINTCSVSKEKDINTKLTSVQPVASVDGVDKQDMEILSNQDKAKEADNLDMEILSSQDKPKVANNEDQDNYRDQDKLKYTLVNSQSHVRNGEYTTQYDQDAAKHGQDEAKHDQDVAKHGQDEDKHSQDGAIHGQDETKHAQDVTKYGHDKAKHGHDKAKHGQDKAKHVQDKAKLGQDVPKHCQDGAESCHSGSSYTPISTASSHKHTDDSKSMSSHSSDDFPRSPRIIRFNQDVMGARYEDLAQSTLPLKDYSGDNLRVFWRKRFSERVADTWASFKGLFTCCVRTKRAKKSADWNCCGITTSVSTRRPVGHETEISARVSTATI